MSDAVPLLIGPADEIMAEMNAAAKALLDACLKVGLSEEGSESAQAWHFGTTALLNAAELDGEMTVKVLGAIVGTTICNLVDPQAALDAITNVATFFYDDAMERRAITYDPPKGSA